MAERPHALLGLTAAVILVGGIVGWRSLRTVGPVVGAAPTPMSATPNPAVSGLMPFAAPLPDSARTIVALHDTIVLRRDPFAGQSVTRTVTEDQPVGPIEPRRRDVEVWHVTTTLVSGNRRAALINDALVYVGDPLPDGSKLTTVERDHVVVTDQKGAAHTVAVAKEGNG